MKNNRGMAGVQLLRCHNKAYRQTGDTPGTDQDLLLADNPHTRQTCHRHMKATRLSRLVDKAQHIDIFYLTLGIARIEAVAVTQHIQLQQRTLAQVPGKACHDKTENQKVAQNTGAQQARATSLQPVFGGIAHSCRG